MVDQDIAAFERSTRHHIGRLDAQLADLHRRNTCTKVAFFLGLAASILLSMCWNVWASQGQLMAAALGSTSTLTVKTADAATTMTDAATSVNTPFPAFDPVVPPPPPPPRDAATVARCVHCSRQHTISSPSLVFTPTYYEYLGLDATQEPIASWILATTDLSSLSSWQQQGSEQQQDNNKQKKRNKNEHNNRKKTDRPQKEKEKQGLSPQDMEKLLEQVRKAVLQASRKRLVVEHVSGEINYRCRQHDDDDEADCSSSQEPLPAPGSARDDDKTVSDDGQRITGVGSPLPQVLLGGNKLLFNSEQRAEVGLISEIYLVLTDVDSASEYNTVFMGPLLHFGNDNGGSSGQEEDMKGGGGSQEERPFRVLQGLKVRREWLHRLCPLETQDQCSE